MKKWILFLLTIFFVGIIFWSCSEDEGTVTPINEAPSCAITSPADNTIFTMGSSITVNVDAVDNDGTIAEVRFYFDDDSIGIDTDLPYSYTIPPASYTESTHTIKVIAEDDDGKEKESQINIIMNNQPLVISLMATDSLVDLGGISIFTCNAMDRDGDALTYSWSATGGSISGTSSSEIWRAPDTIGDYTITCVVSDGTDADSGLIIITAFDSPAGDMVFVQGGTFEMGDHFNEGSSSDELPVHSVTVSDFYIGASEITQSEWELYMPIIANDLDGLGDFHPVYNVTWYHIIAYCNKRSIAEGIIPCYIINDSTNPNYWGSIPNGTSSIWDEVTCDWDANGYRLPTEAEWEYAARGGTYNADNYIYSGSDSIDDVAWHNDNTCHPIRTKAPNQLGIYDMSGNLYEWCWDWYDYNYYTTCNDLDTITNPYGASSSFLRVLRGGSWYLSSSDCSVESRSYNMPGSNVSSRGFRIARTP